jgi:hypothetical protein
MIADFCAIFALIYIVALLLVANAFGGVRSGMAQLSLAAPEKCSCQEAADTCSASVLPSVLYPESAAAGPAEETIKVVMDDGGYATREVNVALSSSRFVDVVNKGVNPHSFVIDEIGIDSGAIAPGETKRVALENLNADAKNYTFYSNIGTDNRESFSGVITAK